MSQNLTKINHKNAPHLVIISVDVKVCEQKSDGSFVPVSKNKPIMIGRKFKDFEEAKLKEAGLLELYSNMAQEKVNGTN